MANNYKTFASRGIYVGFTNSMLLHARCRPSKTEENEYDAMIPNWAGGGALAKGNDLVMSFQDLTSWTQMNERDGFLHELILQRRNMQDGYLDPILARELRMKADVERGDESLVQQAKHELSIATSDVQDAYIDVLAMFGRKYGAVSGQKELEFMTRAILVTLAEEDPRSLMRLVRVIIKTITIHTSINREELEERLSVLSEYAAPMCSLITNETFGDIGYLSRQNMRLKELHDSLAYFADEHTGEIKKAIDIILMNIEAFLAYITEKSSGIKSALLQDSFYLDTKRYEHLLNYILTQRSKISFALDGWARHAESWAATNHADLEDKRHVIFHILREMPTAPKELEEEIERLFLVDNSAMALRHKMVKELHGWGDDKLDQVLHQRIIESRKLSASLSADQEKSPVNDQIKENLK